MLDLYMKLRNISQEDVRLALLAAGYGLTPAQVSRIVKGNQGAKPEYVDVIVKLVGIPKEELWVEADPEKIIKKVREVAQEAVVEAAEGKTLLDPEDSAPEPAAHDTRAERHLHPVADAAPDPYEATEAIKLRSIRSIQYEGPDAVEIVIAPLRLAASPPEQIDPTEEGVAVIPKLEAKVRNAPIFPVKVYGPSMNRKIGPGAVVFYRRTSKPPQGCIVIACVHGDPPTMKWLRGTRLEPDSTDPQVPIDLVEDATFIGEVVAVHFPEDI